MNSEPQLLERLLKLYPVRVVKANFDVESSTQVEQLPEIVLSYTSRAIANFAIENIGFTKQHVYIYDLDKSFDKAGFDKASFPLAITKEVQEGNTYTLTCFPTVEYDVILTNPNDSGSIHFYQPTQISISDKRLIIRTTIIEKKLSHYFESGRKVFEVAKRNGEEEFVRNILFFFEQNYYITKCDLNKGVKKLWNDDVIDSKYAKWKKSKSTTTEVMDEEYTLKSQYPDVYANLINAPLNKMVFKYLKDDENLLSHFTIDPSMGQISFPIFPENVNQVQNVINEILTNN